jgi:hypothetical protein
MSSLVFLSPPEPPEAHTSNIRRTMMLVAVTNPQHPANHMVVSVSVDFFQQLAWTSHTLYMLFP